MMEWFWLNRVTVMLKNVNLIVIKLFCFNYIYITLCLAKSLTTHTQTRTRTHARIYTCKHKCTNTHHFTHTQTYFMFWLLQFNFSSTFFAANEFKIFNHLFFFCCSFSACIHLNQTMSLKRKKKLETRLDLKILRGTLVIKTLIIWLNMCLEVKMMTVLRVVTWKV